jgi:hypothetical protein
MQESASMSQQRRLLALSTKMTLPGHVSAFFFAASKSMLRFNIESLYPAQSILSGRRPRKRQNKQEGENQLPGSCPRGLPTPPGQIYTRQMGLYAPLQQKKILKPGNVAAWHFSASWRRCRRLGAYLHPISVVVTSREFLVALWSILGC